MGVTMRTSFLAIKNSLKHVFYQPKINIKPNLLTIDSIETFLTGKPTPWRETDEVNETAIQIRKGWSWGKVWNEFLDSSKQLLQAYEKIPESSLDERVWDNREDTPSRFLDIDVEHYLEHLKQLTKALE
jgi:hypothetical protein